MKADRPSVRLNEQLQEVLERAGGTSAALRALMVLGALSAGEPFAELRLEVHRLLGDPSLASPVRAALEKAADVRQTYVKPASDISLDGTVTSPPRDAEEAEADPYGELAIKL